MKNSISHPKHEVQLHSFAHHDQHFYALVLKCTWYKNTRRIFKPTDSSTVHGINRSETFWPKNIPLPWYDSVVAWVDRDLTPGAYHAGVEMGLRRSVAVPQLSPP